MISSLEEAVVELPFPRDTRPSTRKEVTKLNNLFTEIFTRAGLARSQFLAVNQNPTGETRPANCYA
jgi:hypothetical protein